MELLDTLVIVEPVVEVFERLGIAYYIGGSVTSSIHGIPRATVDVDLVADIRRKHVPLLVNLLEAVYYIDRDMILEAIQRRASFNLIHLESTLKIDVFILKSSPYAQQAFQRRRKDLLDAEQGLELFLASPEDIILSKLEWFRMGGGVSERQWTDVMGVLKVQQGHLDMPYLRRWAEELGLTDLFTQVCRDAGIGAEDAAEHGEA
jgi:hypothetical protein